MKLPRVLQDWLDGKATAKEAAKSVRSSSSVDELTDAVRRSNEAFANATLAMNGFSSRLFSDCLPVGVYSRAGRESKFEHSREWRSQMLGEWKTDWTTHDDAIDATALSQEQLSRAIREMNDRIDEEIIGVVRGGTITLYNDDTSKPTISTVGPKPETPGRRGRKMTFEEDDI